MDQRVNCMTFLPVLPQISPITSESQAPLAPSRPAGAAGPTRELLSASAQMALRLCSSDTSTDEEGGRRAREGTLEGGGVCKGREKVDTMKRKPEILRHKFKRAGRNVCTCTTEQRANLGWTS